VLIAVDPNEGVMAALAKGLVRWFKDEGLEET
jgi:hypothetical protein